MASIQSLGIGSGLLTSELLDNLIAAERAPVENRLNLHQSLAEAKISAYGEVRSSLSSLESALQGLTLTSTFNSNTATSTDDTLLTATASSLAVAGNYSVSVSTLAQSHSVASDAYESVDSAVGTGVLTFRLGTTSFDSEGNYLDFELNPAAKSKSIIIGTNNNTLGGIRDAVNAADFGVQASIVDDGSGYRLLFTSKESGVEQSIEVTATGSTSLKALNYNQSSEAASLNAVAEAGTVDLSTGAGLSTSARTFSITYKGTALDILVAADPGITDTGTAVAAIQTALDSALAANGFAAGDLLATGEGDVLTLGSAANGFSETLSVDSDGAQAIFSGSTVLSDGFDFSANNAAFSIAIDGGTAHNIVLNTASASRAETVSLINQALVTAGIDASVAASLNDSNELIFTSTAFGAASTIAVSAVDASGTAASAELGLAAGSVTGLDGFGLNTGEGMVTGSVRMQQTLAAQDANFSVNGIAITRGTNLAVGVVPGTTLNLKAVTSGPVTLSIRNDPANTITRIQSFVEAYNGVKSLSNALTEFNPGSGENGEGSLLTGDSTLRFISNELNSLLRSSIPGLDSFSSLADIGITTNQDSGYLLEFDIATFSTEFEANPEDVMALFASSGRTTDSLVEYAGVGAMTEPGTYDVSISRLATVGSYAGPVVASLGAGNIVIDDNSNNFTIELNGYSADIVLTNGSYETADDLAEQIQLQINSHDDLTEAGNSVEVLFDSEAGRFTIESSLYGSESRVRFLETGSTVADTLGFVTLGQGDFQANQLAGLATLTGDSAENFTSAVEINSETSFRLSINGQETALLTLPGDSGSPQSYASPDALIAAIEAQIIADPLFLDPAVPPVSVNYSYDAESGFGRLIFTTGSHADEIAISDTTAGAAGKLGLFIGNGAENPSTSGVDVAGTINGIEAEGLGQTLVAAGGNIPAEPGFYLHAAHGDLSQSSALDSFTISVDGVVSGEITLGAISDTDPTAVALGMQVAINNSPALMAAGVGVVVEYDVNTGGFGIISNSTGATSSVEIVGLSGNAASILGFSAGTGTHGRAGTNATGTPDASAGLRLEITGGELGDRGTVSFTRGVADRLDTLLSGYLGNSGLLTNRTDALNTELDTIAEKRVALDERIARSEERLRASFLANDLIINRLNITADFLTSQLEMLEALAASSMTGKQ